MNTRTVRRFKFRDKPSDAIADATQVESECGCAMCRLKRAQIDRNNHSLSDGVYEREFALPAHDRSPRASLWRTDPNTAAEINRKNQEFWEKRGGIPHD